MRLKLLVPLGLVQERWRTDRAQLMARAKELGAEVSLQAIDFETALQNIRNGNLQTQGVSVLVVVAPNSGEAGLIVEEAHRSGVPVIAYDRLINDCDLDLYVSFDNEKIGEMQASYLVERKPAGNYVLIGGPPTDLSAKACRRGQMKVLQPYIDRGDIQIVEDQCAKDWLSTEALQIMEVALEKCDGRVDAVLASNDGMAGGAIHALGRRGLEGKVLVSGQDADRAACQRIMAGTQSMTVYKPFKSLACLAAEAAVAVAKKQPLPHPTTMVHNNRIDVPSILLKPVLVDRDNLDSTVIADGFHSREELSS